MQIDKLSPRERQVLHKIAEGATREEISEFMSISKHTYDDYRKNIRVKLNIHNNADWMRVLWEYTNLHNIE